MHVSSRWLVGLMRASAGTLIALGCAGPGRASAELPLQEFACTGYLKRVTIYQDHTRRKGRRVNSVFSDDSSGDDFLTRSTNGDIVVYTDSEKGIVMRFVASRLEFWEDGKRVPDHLWAKCVQTGESRSASFVAQPSASSTYRCSDATVRLTPVAGGRLQLKTMASDGETQDLFQIVKGTGYDKLMTDESIRREASDWAKSQGSGFSSYHVRRFHKQDRLEFWSQGGGKMEAAKMYRHCER